MKSNKSSLLQDIAWVYRILDHPFIYKISSILFAPGSEMLFTRTLRRLSKEFHQPPGVILDVGCGPASWLWKIGWHPVGLDISHEYTKAFRQHGRTAINGSASELPFASGGFDSVWCIGLLHHLTDELARRTIMEMLRVCRAGGQVIIQDAVLPESAWRRPVAALIRRMDRGKNMRDQDQLAALLPGDQNWHIRRYTYTLNGLEMLECYFNKPRMGTPPPTTSQFNGVMKLIT